MKRSELRRKTPMKRTGAKRAKSPVRKLWSSFRDRVVGIKPVNRKRRQTEFARTYHSRERVRWVKGLPCLACLTLSPFVAAVTGPSDNAHTETDGAGRKADYDRIVPLCRAHHRRYDEHQFPFDTPEARQLVKDAAPRIEALWLNHLTRSGRTAA